ncbi:MAG: BamA/TamA family outer membrane protein, partial [Holosporales bacterium]|nr:BamA/TamA family outer membrane protein [Holosporales bacterium]
MSFFKFRIFIIFFVFLLMSTIANSIEIKGVDDPVIFSMIKEQITTKKNDTNLRDSIFIQHRLESDKNLITTILHSFGYFDCEVEWELSNDKIIFKISQNERYKFNDIALKYEDDENYSSGIKVGEVFSLINIDFDSYITTREIANAAVKIKEFLQSKGFAFVSTSQPELEIDKDNKKIKAIYHITLNGKVKIDKTIINIKSKNNTISLLQFVKNRILWKNGDIYDLEKINQTKDDLMNSGIFSGIEIILTPPTKDELDKTLSHTTMTINLEEALLRDMAAGVKYGTSERLGALFSWAHYNIDGKGSKLTTILDIAKNNRTVKIKHDLYDLFYKKQQLTSQAFGTKENTTSYEVAKIGTESILWQEFNKGLKAGIGGCFENAKTKDKVEPTDSNAKFCGFGIPICTSFDTTDSFLDPQKGVRCSGSITPYLGNVKNFAIMSGKASTYISILKNRVNRVVILAFYSKIGSILRDEKSKIPRDRLFFRGGADSIRGYGYQKLGPISEDKKPFGGRSFFEFGIEPRIKINVD